MRLTFKQTQDFYKELYGFVPTQEQVKVLNQMKNSTIFTCFFFQDRFTIKTTETLAIRSGFSATKTLGILKDLQTVGLVEETEGGWQKKC